MLALPLPILGKSRMRKRARTNLCGAISNGRPYRDNNTLGLVEVPWSA